MSLLPNILHGFGIPFSALMSVIFGLMIVSFPLGAYAIFNSDIGDDIDYTYPLEKFDIFWAEEPARRWDYKGLKMVSDNIKAAVSSGENLNNVGDFYPLIDNQAVDILNVSSYQSGITGLRQIGNFAYAYELPVTTMNCIGNYNAQIATSIPNHIMMH